MPDKQHSEDQSNRLSIAILGCGKLGTSLLHGFLSPKRLASPISTSHSLSSSITTPLEISHINVTVRQPSSVDRIQHSLQEVQSTSPEYRLSTVDVRVGLQDQNGQAAQEADIVVLGCKSSAFKDILSDQGVREGLLGSGKWKTLVSVMGGVSIAQLESCLYASEDPKSTGAENLPECGDSKRLCTVIRAVPNMAARNQESITVLSSSSPSALLEDDRRQANRLFALLGPTMNLPESKLNHASALAASSLAFYTTILSAAADGGLGDGNGQGLSRKDAIWIAAQAARGASGLVIAGKDPDDVVADVATKGGSTAVGLQVMEEGGVRKAVTRAVEECVRATASLSNAYQRR